MCTPNHYTRVGVSRTYGKENDYISSIPVCGLLVGGGTSHGSLGGYELCFQSESASSNTFMCENVLNLCILSFIPLPLECQEMYNI